MYDSDCQIYCNWSKLKPGFNAHRSTMPQINMIAKSVSESRQLANRCSVVTNEF